MNKAAASIHVDLFIILSSKYPEMGLLDYTVKSMINFMWITQAVFQSDCTILNVC